MLDKKSKFTFHRSTTSPAVILKIRSWSESIQAPTSRSPPMKTRKSKTMSLNRTIRGNSTSGIHLICQLARTEEELWWNCTTWASNSSPSTCWLWIEPVTMSKKQLRYCSTNRCSRSYSELDTERFPERKEKLKSCSQGVVTRPLTTTYLIEETPFII